MLQTSIDFLERYTPVGDIIVLAGCFIFTILIRTAYIKKTRNFNILRDMIIMLALASVFHVFFHISLDHVGSIPVIFIYAGLIAVHFCVFSIMWLFILYMREPIHLEAKIMQIYSVLGTIGFVAIISYDILGALFQFGFYIDYSGEVHDFYPAFNIAYGYFVLLIASMIFLYRGRIFKQIRHALVCTMTISVIMIVIQNLFGEESFTMSTFIFPVFALLYLMHSNPYDIESGALGYDAFEDMIGSFFEKGERCFLMSLYMPDFDKGNRTYPLTMIETIRYFYTDFFKGAKMFKFSGGHLMLVIDIKKNPDYELMSQKMIDEFYKVYPLYNRDYKIVTTMTWDKISENQDYAGFIGYLHDNMSINSIYRAGSNDVMAYTDSKYILAELEDINLKKDLNDPRVLVYCQPVYDIKTGKYTTAEALMRLKLPKLGMVYPDKFIPIAERNGYINVLTQIILSKTCHRIKDFCENGYELSRISVNFSAFDVINDNFCKTVKTIICDSGISFDKIAIEITETQNDENFELIKSRISDLQSSGIKFYLDDFGTGYSNFERIMEIPFDIIKFDRSMVTGSGTDVKFRNMVSHLAGMFSEMDYSVLYEGIESDDDEARCMDMYARYLQGYKYSKPIPIESLSEYFEKKPV